jgi:ubiquinone/menaquinone biosynthesis C-methylase UbiE
VPKEWLSEIQGKHVLCLAAGGGQQVPILAAVGAVVVSFDLSEEQLNKDKVVAAREGLSIKCVRGDMANLACFPDESFDLIFHPASNVFARNIEPVWHECYRVLRPGGSLLAGFMNPAAFLFDHDETEETGELVVRYSLPYSDEESLGESRLNAKIEAHEALEYSHSLTAQIGGQTTAGFVVAGLYEDHWYDDTWRFSNYSPVSIATKAIRLR